jgi:hypothetical protein
MSTTFHLKGNKTLSRAIIYTCEEGITPSIVSHPTLFGLVRLIDDGIQQRRIMCDDGEFLSINPEYIVNFGEYYNPREAINNCLSEKDREYVVKSLGKREIRYRWYDD